MFGLGFGLVVPFQLFLDSYRERGQYTFTIVTVKVIAIITKPILLLSTFSVCRQIFQENNFKFSADEAPTTKAHASKGVCNT